MSTAIVVAPQDDLHAQAVRHAGRAIGGEIHILDLQEFTHVYDIRTRIGRDGASLQVGPTAEGRDLDVADAAGLWWRRPHPRPGVGGWERLPHGVFTVAEDERRAALIGSLDALAPRAFNDLGCSRQATYKPAQLVRARSVGLAVPETLITNDAEAAKEFLDAVDGRAIYKMVTGPALHPHGPRTVDEVDRGALDRLQTCPTIFQEFVEGDYDIRATVVGDQVFAARLTHTDSDVLATRLAPATVTAHELPMEVADRLVRLVQGFGLVYSAVDLRYCPDRGYVFFELNPDGQYLWTEIEADLPISHEIATLLLA